MSPPMKETVKMIDCGGDCPLHCNGSATASVTAPAVGETPETILDSLRLSEMVNALVHRYVELAEALPPKQGEDTMGRTATKVHAPSPVDTDTVDERAAIRKRVREGMALRQETAALLFRIRAYASQLNLFDTEAFVVGPCPKPDCEAVLELDGDQLRCRDDDAHNIPRAMWPTYARMLR